MFLYVSPQEAVNYLEGLGVEVQPRGYEWAAERGMNAFLSVTQGSAEPPVFLELTYRGAGFSEHQPVAIVGESYSFSTLCIQAWRYLADVQ